MTWIRFIARGKQIEPRLQSPIKGFGTVRFVDARLAMHDRVPPAIGRSRNPVVPNAISPDTSECASLSVEVSNTRIGHNTAKNKGRAASCPSAAAVLV